MAHNDVKVNTKIYFKRLWHSLQNGLIYVTLGIRIKDYLIKKRKEEKERKDERKEKRKEKKPVLLLSKAVKYYKSRESGILYYL